MAFWRRKENAADPRPKRASSRSTDETADELSPLDAVRVRARRRLIGAAALLLTVAIVVPMLLDPEPKPNVRQHCDRHSQREDAVHAAPDTAAGSGARQRSGRSAAGSRSASRKRLKIPHESR